jgi:TetR/AcrR family acrAB operon transcriptional repressor
MARKTKEEAQATRGRILDAAERVFQAHGVSNTSLHNVALAAGVTRGAVYWHFKDKGDLFNAMLARVCLPMEETAAQGPTGDGRSALATLREHLFGILERVAGDEQVRRVFEIATQKVEFVGELTAVRERRVQMRRDHITALERLLRATQVGGEIVADASPRQVAIGLHALLDGLLQSWMLDPIGFDLRAVGGRAIDLQLAGLTAGERPIGDTSRDAVGQEPRRTRKRPVEQG